MTQAGVELLRFARSEGVPNNALAVVLRHGVHTIVGDAAACEELFTANGWTGTWRNGIFPFQHFHSNAHEALGIIAGDAVVLLGGPGGREVRLVPGDVVVLPAGTGHERRSPSPDLLVVGAYPPGQAEFDLRRGDPAELDKVLRNVARVELPASDPVQGTGGALVVEWAATAAGRT